MMDRKLSGILHGILHMMSTETPITSAELAAMMGTNAVVVRRTMSGLRDAGIVASARGPGGGWVLCCDPGTVTLADIYRALGEPALVALGHRSDCPTCLVEQSVNDTLDAAFRDAEAAFNARLSAATLSSLAADVGRRLALRGEAAGDQHHAA